MTLNCSPINNTDGEFVQRGVFKSNVNLHVKAPMFFSAKSDSDAFTLPNQPPNYMSCW